MKKEVFETLKKELQYIGMLFLLVLTIFKIAFFKEEFIVLFRTVLSLFWLFALPGWIIMLYWQDKLDFIERFIIGIIVSAGIIGILSYYLGLIGLNIKYHTILLPLAIMAVGLIAVIKKKEVKTAN